MKKVSGVALAVVLAVCGGVWGQTSSEVETLRELVLYEALRLLVSDLTPRAYERALEEVAGKNKDTVRYLGRLSRNKFDPDSVANPYGRYGSPDSFQSPYNPYSFSSPYLLEDGADGLRDLELTDLGLSALSTPLYDRDQD